LVKQENEELKNKYGDERRTEISEQAAMDFGVEDLIPHQRVVVTLSNRGFIKRVPSTSYRSQHRRGKGVIGMGIREADAVRLLAVADTHDDLFFFTNRGKVFHLKCHEVPADVTRSAKGLAIVNLFPIAEGEQVTAMVATTGLKPDFYMIMATRRGEVKKTAVAKFANIRSSGIIAMDLEKGDELISAGLAQDEDDVIMITEKGQSIRFKVATLRSSSRTSGGVRGVRLDPDDQVVSMDVAKPDAFLLVVTVNGYGKLTPTTSYKRQNRGGVGIKTLKVTDKTGKVAATRQVTQTQQLLVISSEGMVISTPMKEGERGIPIRGRSTQGVRIMKLDPGDKVAAIAAFE